MATAVTSTTSSAANSAAAKTAKTLNDAATPDRFLMLVVALIQNQDPLNPLDNAQVTSQMAQISTVAGIEKMNTSIGAMSASFAQMQQLTGASLVGREVLVSGDLLKLDAVGKGGGGYELAQTAEAVTVDVLSTTGTVLDTIELGPQSAGRHSFDWTIKAGVNPASVAAFRVNAQYGDQAVQADPLMRDKVKALLMGGSQLQLELATLGNVNYADIKAFQ